MRLCRILIVLSAALALAGCVTEHAPQLPMALAPADDAQSSCLRYGDAPTFGDCLGKIAEKNRKPKP